MLGSNPHGSAYYGQGPGSGVIYTPLSISASVTALASISLLPINNLILSATVTAIGSIGKVVTKVLSATVTVVATVTTVIVLSLHIRRATTKFLNLFRTTRIFEATE
jgi:hypothetical protein